MLPKAPQVCLEMQQGLYTHQRIREGVAANHHQLVLSIIQWPHQDSLTTLWELDLTVLLQHLEPEVLRCQGVRVKAEWRHRG